MAEQIETVGIIKIQTDQAEKNTKSLREQIKETREEMGRLAANGDRTSEAYQQLAQKAGDLAKAQREVNKDVSEASTTFSNTVSYVSGSLAGVSGAVQTVTGALSMMGIEMGNDGKLMKMLVSAMSVTSGLQAVQNSVDVFKLLATNIKRATGEQKLLNAAMKMSPIGLVVAALGTMVALTAKYARQQKEVIENQRQQNIETEKSKASAYSEIALMNAYIKMGKDENISRQKKIEIMNTINSKWPTLKATYNEETNEVNILKSAYQDLTASIIEASMAKGFQKQLDEISEKLAETEGKIKNKRDEINKLNKEEETARRTNVSNTSAMGTGAGYGIFAGNATEADVRDVEFKKRENRLNNDMKNLEADKKKLLADQSYFAQLVAKYTPTEKGGGTNTPSTTTTPTKAETDQADKDLEKYCEILDSFRTARQKEIDDATEKYTTEYDILEKYGEDTTELTERYNKTLQEINDRYDREEKEKGYNADSLQADRDYNNEKLEILRSGKENYLEELEALDMRQFDTERNLLKEQRDLGLIEEQEYQDALTQIAIEEQEKRNEAEKNAVEKHKETLETAMNATQTILSSTNTILDAWASKMADDGEEETNQYKAIKKAEAIISMLAGEVQVIAGVAGKNPTPWGIASAVAQGAALVATCMTTIHQIDSVSTTSSNSNVNTATASTLSRNYTNTRLTDGSGAEIDLSALADSINSKKVYVTVNDINNAQNKVKVTTRRNTF